ncbi:zinc finger CCCH domain-containing protein 12-like isoform X1 [Solanum lycopersicum]|uniref:zinc finger CCCH domain-containing protein 12-like isoform X1 n=1 Tax=Solanum lycopersicum TaxID=4081 RepID=UPI0008FEAFD5|nr:zinc finger CCCH domain-containing protein 12-like isoform X1 [Solanum lycopersicum]
MSSLVNNIEISSKCDEYSDKKCGSNFNVECVLKKPIAKDSGMAQEGNRPICTRFQRWGNCSYGERCRYVHTAGGSTYGPLQGGGYDQSYVEEGKSAYRESAAITIVSGGNEVKNKSYSDNVEPKSSVDFRTRMKTRLCNSWERDGSCFFGARCQFAHGRAELQGYGSSNPLVSSSNAGISAPAKKVAPNEVGSSAPAERRFKWNDVRKISQVYGDWIE